LFQGGGDTSLDFKTVGEKRFPISDLKKDKLRKAGVMVVSKELATFAIFLSLGALYSILSSGGVIESVLELLSKLDHDGVSIIPALRQSFSKAVSVLFYCLMVVCGCYLLIHFLQTRFLIKPGLVFSGISSRFGFGRLFSLRFNEAVIFLVLLMVWSGVSYLVLNFLIFQLGEIDPRQYFNLGQEDIRGQVAERLDQLAVTILPFGYALTTGVCFITGIVVFLVRKINFDREHMMTRGEIELEAKEYEVDQNMRRSQYERSVG